MKQFLTLLLLFSFSTVFAQKRRAKMPEQPPSKVDSMFVNLYTDSLKKGTYNYINVDGLLSNGRYIPLDSTEVIFASSDGRFSGNSLWIDRDFKKKKVSVSVTLRSDPAQCRVMDIYIKQAPDPELRSEEEILRGMQSGSKRRRG